MKVRSTATAELGIRSAPCQFLPFPDGISAGLIRVEKADDHKGDHRRRLPVDNPSRSAEWHHVDGLTGRRDDRRNGTLQLVPPIRLRQPRNGKSAPLLLVRTHNLGKFIAAVQNLIGRLVEAHLQEEVAIWSGKPIRFLVRAR